MSQIGYYNYYNNPHRYSPTEVVDRYQEMVDRATGDEIYANNEDPYSERNKALRKIKELLESNNDSRDIFYWGLNNGAKYSEESLTKWRAYQNVKKYSGLELQQLQLVDGKFYTENEEDAWELIKEGISKDNSIAPEFKGVAYDYVQGLMDVVADKGWDNIPDIQMDIMYSGKNGLYVA